MINKIKNNAFIILILVISFVLAFKNYSPNTFLSGWDTLHPEFNFGIAFQREINAVFRPEQGLGAVAAHSHMADLPHSIILYLFHFVFPISDLRYLYILLNLILGPIGIYLLLKRHIVKSKAVSFLGSLFYLLNLGTLQTFVVPFEMFTTQYALLPWVFLFATNYVFSNPKSLKQLFLFCLSIILIMPSAYAATLWYIFFFTFILYLSSLSAIKRSLLIFNRSTTLIFITLAINSFWIMPNIYYALTQGQQVANAMINQLLSPQAFLYNKEFGTIKDIALLKNFLFGWSVYSNNSFPLLLSPWISHLNQWYIQLIGYLFALVALSGVIKTFLKKDIILIALFPSLLLCLFFLINDNFPTAFLYNLLQAKIPLFKEAFRFPGDKALGLFTFIFTIYFAKGLEISMLEKIKKIQIGYLAIFSTLIIYYMLPAFKGDFISPHMRVTIPQYYFEAFNWLNYKPKTARIAELPINSMWGWKYYKWDNNKPSFQGADFLQFGIAQPLLDRDFDRWNPNNEQYYREMSQAIYSQDQNKLNNVFKKYDISYILWDRSVIAPEQGQGKKVLFFGETEKLLNDNLSLQKVANFGNIWIYENKNHNPQVRLLENPISLGPPAVFYEDFAYAKYQDYITYLKSDKNTVLYPFRNIINNQSKVISTNIISSLPKPSNLDNILTLSIKNECSTGNLQNQNDFQKTIVYDKFDNYAEYKSIGGSFCDSIPYSSLPRNQGYLVSITSRILSGLPLRICIVNYISQRCDLYAHLSESKEFKTDTFLVPPIDQGMGFSLNFHNFSVKDNLSINHVKSIQIMPFDYEKLLKTETYFALSNQEKNKKVIIYSQSFDSGWKAYAVKDNNWLTSFLPFVFGKEIKEHVLVNNWANGWVINSAENNNPKFAIIFWPQYLEYLGLGILIGVFVWLLFLAKKG